MKPTFLISGLIPALTIGALALPLLAAPAMAQPYYGYRYPDREIPVTGAQMTDWPSGRFNLTQSGSFLRLGRHADQDRTEYHRHYRHEYRGYDDRGYYGRRGDDR